MRRGLIVLLGLGVVAGYGSALAHARYRWHHDGGCGGGDRWSQRWERPAPVVSAPVVTAPAPAPAPVQPIQQVQQLQPVVPQIIIVQTPGAAPAAAPTVIYAPAPAPAAAPAEKAAQPAAKPTGQE